jgi:hypothetical protein
MAAVIVTMAIGATGAVTQAHVSPNFGPPIWGWATVRSDASSYTLPGAWHGSISGDPVKVQHQGAGRYRVSFGGITNSGGNAQVTALGNNRNVCQIFTYKPNLNTSSLDVQVHCYAPSGAAANTPFSLSYLEVQIDAGPLAYLYATGTSSETPDAQYLFTSNSGGAHVQRQSKGTYLVKLFGMETSGGHAQVTAFQSSTSNVHCVVDTFQSDVSDEDVHVLCFDEHAHAIDNPFLLVFTKNEALMGNGIGTSAYLLANRVSTHSYTPLATYRYSSASGATNVTRTSKGRYTVSLTGMPGTGAVQVSAFGAADVDCHPTSISRRAPSPLQINVRCDGSTGTPADYEFLLLFEH